MTTALNAPCPCGSGKKHKRCCYQEEALAAKSAKKGVPRGIALASLVGAVVAFLVTGDGQMSILIGAGGLIIALAVGGFSDPPPPRGGTGNPAGLNFGR